MDQRWWRADDVEVDAPTLAMPTIDLGAPQVGATMRYRHPRGESSHQLHTPRVTRREGLAGSPRALDVHGVLQPLSSQLSTGARQLQRPVELGIAELRRQRGVMPGPRAGYVHQHRDVHGRCHARRKHLTGLKPTPRAFDVPLASMVMSSARRRVTRASSLRGVYQAGRGATGTVDQVPLVPCDQAPGTGTWGSCLKDAPPVTEVPAAGPTMMWPHPPASRFPIICTGSPTCSIEPRS